MLVKLIACDTADAREVRQRTEVLEVLASIHPPVVGPERIAGELVTEVGGWWAIAHRWVDGRPSDTGDPADAAVMGVALAHLHAAMARVDAGLLPPLAALTAGHGEAGGADRADWQLLHGDFSAANTLHADDGLRIIDLDDCGVGPVTFDVACSLYMVLFDAAMDGDRSRYERFREHFLEAYTSAGRPLDAAEIEAAIERRRSALRHWLDHPDEAPTGIRLTTDSWKARLREFAERP